jgi:hypothetical protein
MSQRYWQQRYDGARRLVAFVPELISSAQAAPADPAPLRPHTIAHSYR